jgi:protoporphyrinogen oxidase
MLLSKPISHYYVTNITDTSIPLTGIIEMSALVDREEFGGSHLIYLPKYVPCNDSMFEMTDEQIQERFVSSVESMYSTFDRNDIQAFKISRVRSVMAIPTLDYSERLPSMKTSISGIYVVNSAHILRGNLNVNETIQIAEDAMESILLPVIQAGVHPKQERLAGESEKHLVG